MLAHSGTVHHYGMLRAASVLGQIISLQYDMHNSPK